MFVPPGVLCNNRFEQGIIPNLKFKWFMMCDASWAIMLEWVVGGAYSTRRLNLTTEDLDLVGLKVIIVA